MSNTKKTTNETAPIETAAALVPFYVVITVCDLETGQAVQALARELRGVNQSPVQAMYHFPKHSPQALVAALVSAADDLAWEAGLQAKFLAHAESRIAQLEASQDIHFGRVADQWEEQEDGRQFLETCAAERSFRDLLA